MATALRLTQREMHILAELRDMEAMSRDEDEWGDDLDGWRYYPSDEDAAWAAAALNADATEYSAETPQELADSLEALGHQLDALVERLDRIPPIRTGVGDEDVLRVQGCVG